MSVESAHPGMRRLTPADEADFLAAPRQKKMDAVDELDVLLGIGPPKAKLPITLIKSGYAAIKSLGKGGFGQAHLVFQQEQKKYYVVKHINLSQLNAAGLIAMHVNQILF